MRRVSRRRRGTAGRPPRLCSWRLGLPVVPWPCQQSKSNYRLGIIGLESNRWIKEAVKIRQENQELMNRDKGSSCWRATPTFLERLLDRPTLVGKALCFTHELSFFLSYQSTALSSRAVDGHQMYFGGSVVAWCKKKRWWTHCRLTACLFLVRASWIR